jgi:hypothetical protein
MYEMENVKLVNNASQISSVCQVFAVLKCYTVLIGS